MTRKYTPEQAQAALERKRKYRRDYFKSYRIEQKHPSMQKSCNVHIPPEVEADRQRRLAQEPTSLTAAICHDPLPGRSALAAKQRSERA